MSPEQLTAVKELLDGCFGGGTWSMDALRSQLEKPDSRCTVAVAGDTVVGFLAFEQILDEGSIVEVAVHPDHRRRGIARHLIVSAIKGAENLHTVFLEVRESNLPAIALYESLGFEKISKRKNYYDHPKEDGMVMEKRVSESCRGRHL